MSDLPEQGDTVIFVSTATPTIVGPNLQPKYRNAVPLYESQFVDQELVLLGDAVPWRVNLWAHASSMAKYYVALPPGEERGNCVAEVVAVGSNTKVVRTNPPTKHERQTIFIASWMVSVWLGNTGWKLTPTPLPEIKKCAMELAQIWLDVALEKWPELLFQKDALYPLLLNWLPDVSAAIDTRSVNVVSLTESLGLDYMEEMLKEAAEKA